MFKKNIEEALQVNVYQTSMDFLEEFKNQYDVLFLDIEMVGDDGLQVAREVRKTDSSVAIIFVTNMAQYAIEGYKVNAIDFMVAFFGNFLIMDIAICTLLYIHLKITPSHCDFYYCQAV